MERDQSMIRLYVPETTIRRMRRADFYLNKTSPLPSVSALFDDISRQRIIEEDLNKDVKQTENMLQSPLDLLQVNNLIND